MIQAETKSLRLKFHELRISYDYKLIVKYELQYNVKFSFRAIIQKIGRLLRLVGLDRSHYCNRKWTASLKHNNQVNFCKTILIHAQGYNIEQCRIHCNLMRDLLKSFPGYVPVLLTDTSDFTFFSRLGWLIEYLPDLQIQGSSYLQRKLQHLAWLYRDASIVPLSASNCTITEFRELLDNDINI